MIKHKPILLLTIALLGLLACNGRKPVMVNETFNTDWQFYKSSDTSEFAPVNAAWEHVTLPHTANLEPLTVTDQWQGICFYRKSFKLDPKYQDKAVSLQFDGAMNVADVWVNGKKMMRHLGGYLPFVIELTDVARFDTLNTILMRLDNRDNPVTGPKPMKILDFNMYGGLYRNVHLLVKEKIHLSNPISADVIAGGGVFFSTTSAYANEAKFEIKTHIINQSGKNSLIRVKCQLSDTGGNIITSLESSPKELKEGLSSEIILNGAVSNPSLWSPSNPNLYILKTEVYADNRLTDSQTDRVGLRSIRITPEGLWLNGEKMFLRGVNRHQEYPYVGYALSDASQYRDAYKIKQAGFDFVRCSHYPPSPAFLDACDELGIMVLDAILGWQYFGDKEFEQLALRSSRELIRRDRNHPSILAWELSINETGMPKSFTDSAHIIAHEEYPCNNSYSAGWVRQSYDIYIEARQHRHGLYPEKPLLVSEYGDWEYFAQNAGFNQQDWKNLLDEERNSRQPRFAGEKRMLQQALNIQEAHNDNLSTHAFADAYWVMFDYNRGMAPEHEYSGIMDIFRLPKFSQYFFQSQRSISDNNAFYRPLVYIASLWIPGQSKGVRVFSNCEEVELFVDNKPAGRQKPDQNALTTNLYHPPFTFDISCSQPGTVKAVGYVQNKKVVEYSVSTPSIPDNIALELDESGRKPTRNDVLFVYAKINDPSGTVIHTDSSMVHFLVEGAQFIGPAKVKAQAGIATILIRTSNAASNVKIEASRQGMKPGMLNFEIQ